MKHILLLLWLIPVISVAQEKELSRPKSGIEVDLKSGTLKDLIPIDEDITLFGTLIDSTIESGSYAVWERLGKVSTDGKCPAGELIPGIADVCYQKVNEGALAINKKNFEGKVKYFFEANKTYAITFRYSKKLPAEFTGFVKLSLLNYYRELYKIASLPPDLQEPRILLSKSRLEKQISAKAAKMGLDLPSFVILGSLLDRNQEIISDLIQPTIINAISAFDQKIDNIEILALQTGTLLRSFASAGNIQLIDALYPSSFSNNLKALNEDKEVASNVGKGLVYLADTVINNPIDIATVDELHLKNLIATIKQNQAVIEEIAQRPEFLSEIQILKDIDNNMSNILAFYESIHLGLSDLKDIQTELLNANINSAKEIIKVFAIEESVTGDFETSAKWYISADIGAAALNLAKNTAINPNASNDSWKILSYLGINISLIPVNKKNSFRRLRQYYDIKTSLLKLTSISLGVTMSTLDKEKYKGIFNIDSPRGLLTGIGIRPIPQIKLSIGGIWYNRNNGNAMVDSFTITSKLYFSASLDWDLRTILPSIKSLFN